MQSLVTARVPENAQGELQGAIMSLYSLSAIFGPLIMGRVFATYSDDVGRYMPGAPFVGAALLIVGAMLAFTVAVSRMDKKSPAK
jgi:DHA1 family tetracycline resistance protein-like MFS transporter